ncbi:MAG TPA: EutN/CcmL family microcompartment protein [Vicinamibacteria bacterium]|jgi:ethanolamine utilization protein EutN|nr:EutN/CcmL family microcompartment protein [Vicinamibacteria bacterium]
MILGKVTGTVVSTVKHYKVEGSKLLLVQPLDLQGKAEGGILLAIDSVDAGVGDRVLVVLEGRAAGMALGRSSSPVDAAVVGVVDAVNLE